MIEIRNEASLDQYVKKNIFAEVLKIVEAKGGTRNYLYKVETSDGDFYVKQALKGPKNPNLTGLFARDPPTRIRTEWRFIDATKSLFPPEIELPEVLVRDEDNNIMIQKDVARGGRLLQDVLLGSGENSFNYDIAHNIGRYLGILHENTLGVAEPVRGSIEQDINFFEDVVELKTSYAVRNARQCIVDKVARFRKHELKGDIILLHSNCVPKNILAREDGSVGIIDFEEAVARGDPAFDLGSIVGHYILHSKLENHPDSALSTLKGIFEGYERETAGGIAFIDRTATFCGTFLYHRVDGTGKAKYVSDMKKQGIRSLGDRLILNVYNSFSELIEAIKSDRE